MPWGCRGLQLQCIYHFSEWNRKEKISYKNRISVLVSCIETVRQNKVEVEGLHQYHLLEGKDLFWMNQKLLPARSKNVNNYADINVLWFPRLLLQHVENQRQTWQLGQICLITLTTDSMASLRDASSSRVGDRNSQKSSISVTSRKLGKNCQVQLCIQKKKKKEEKSIFLLPD